MHEILVLVHLTDVYGDVHEFVICDYVCLSISCK